MTLLATLEDFFIYRGSTLAEATVDEQARATFALEAASEVVRGYCRRIFDLTTETVTLHGTGTWKLLLPNPPILEILGVTEVDLGVVDPDDYRLDPDAGILALVGTATASILIAGGGGGTWLKGFRNYEVEMEHGYLLPGESDSVTPFAEDLPTDIQMVVISVASRQFDSAGGVTGGGPTSSITIGEYTEAFETGGSETSGNRETLGLSPLEAGALDRYRLVRIG